jgi:hypothetical protein
MPPIRPALTLLATVGLLTPATVAQAATTTVTQATTSTLTPTPPVPLPAAPARGSTTTTPDGLPRTGTDLPEELLVAVGLLAAGGALRIGVLPDRG